MSVKRKVTVPVGRVGAVFLAGLPEGNAGISDSP
jgi:hypothetical protein